MAKCTHCPRYRIESYVSWHGGVIRASDDDASGVRHPTERVRRKHGVDRMKGDTVPIVIDVAGVRRESSAYR